MLFLNPHLRADHPVTQGLQAKGLVVLLAASTQEASQMLSLQGATLDLVILHREDAATGNTEGGLKFLAKLKADRGLADIPVLVTSHSWSDVEFAKHQASPQGANAYLKWPADAAAIYSMVEAVFGGSIPSSEASRLISTEGLNSSPSIPMAIDTSSSGMMVLEEPSSIMAAGQSDAGSLSLNLEMPEGFELQDAQQMTRVAIPPPAPSAPSEPVHTEVSSLELSPLEITGTNEIDATRVAATRVDAKPEFSAALSLVLAQAAEDNEPSGPTLMPVSEAEAAEDMPYLFAKLANAKAQSAAIPAAVAFTLPLGDAVVPGGAANAPDSDTLKKYLLLREQDVAVLSSQLKAAKEQVHALDSKLRDEQNKSNDLTHVNAELLRKVDDHTRERQQALDGMQAEMNELRFQLKAKGDKARILDVKVREAAEETERLKERVRTDIRKIRVREKELENRLEIVKKDSEALLAARENKIIELKRKLDLLEFNMDLLQDQHARERENATKLRERLARAAQVVRVAGGLLDSPGGASPLAASLPAEADGEDVA